MVDTGGTARHPVSTERLMEYWAHGKGAQKIKWGVSGDFERCRVAIHEEVPGMPDRMLAGLCSNLHVRATGARPGHAPGEAGK